MISNHALIKDKKMLDDNKHFVRIKLTLGRESDGDQRYYEETLEVKDGEYVMDVFRRWRDGLTFADQKEKP